VVYRAAAKCMASRPEQGDMYACVFVCLLSRVRPATGVASTSGLQSSEQAAPLLAAVTAISCHRWRELTPAGRPVQVTAL
jgi:hypothetical protein